MIMHNRLLMLLCLFLFVLPVLLGGWVDPTTADVYSANIVYADTNGYSVTNLSGPVTFYLSSYSGLIYDDKGAMINSQANSKIGFINTGSGVYDCRVTSMGGFQVSQTYYYGSTLRTVWIDYDIYPTVLPTSYSLPEFSMIYLVFVLFIIASISVIMRGVIS